MAALCHVVLQSHSRAKDSTKDSDTAGNAGRPVALSQYRFIFAGQSQFESSRRFLPYMRSGQRNRALPVSETNVKRAIFLAVAALAMATFNAFAAGKTVMVGGQAMYPSKDIVDNAVNPADHTTLVAAVKAAGLVDTLKILRLINA